MKPLNLSHITLTVKNIEQERIFYSVLFDTELEIQVDHVINDARKISLQHIISFREYNETPKDDKFSYNRIGLDHFAIQVSDEKELEIILPKIIQAWKAVDPKVTDGKTKGIEICPHSGKKYICFRDPSDLPIEFYIGN